MPFASGSSKATFSSNVAELIRSGHSKEQSLAIAYKKKRGDDGVSAREYDLNGWPEIKGNPLSKVGVFPYYGKNIDPTLEPNKIYMVLRPEEELSNPETIQSFRLLPWVDDHPEELLGPEEVGRMPTERKRIEGVIGEDVYYDNSTGMLRGNLKLFSDSLTGKIDDDGKRELSIGYGCKYELASGMWKGKKYDAIQREIRGNHLATVSQGRMGPDVAVLDKLTFTFDAKDIQMPDTKEKPDDQKELSMDDVMSWVKENGPKMSKMQDMMNKHFGAKDGSASEGDPDDTGIAADKAKDEEEKMKEKEAADKKAADEAEEKKKDEEKAADKKAADAKAATDAALDARVKALDADVKDWQKNAFKKVMGEIKRRDSLASQISNFVGAFDSSDMTLAETAAYGVEKLGLKIEAGHEVAALDAFFHNRKPPTAEVGFSNDGAGADAGTGNRKSIDEFLAA